MLFFIKFPELYCMSIACQELHVLSLGTKPMNIQDLFADVEVFQCVKVGMVSFEFIVVVILLATLYFFGRVEDNETSCPISKCQEGTCGVKLDSGDVVFFQ